MGMHCLNTFSLPSAEAFAPHSNLLLMICFPPSKTGIAQENTG